LDQDNNTEHSFLDEETELENSEAQLEKFILINKLEKYIFSPGIITWKRNIVLYSPGDLLDHKYLEKFKKVTDRLPCDYILNPINISKFDDIFSDFKIAKKFKTKNVVRIKAMKWFKNHYWEGDKKAVLAELMEAGYEVFYDLPEELDLKLKESNIDLFRVYSLKASLMVVLSVAIGIIDFKYLKDLYHLPFFFYMGLKEPLAFNHVEAFKYEWSNQGRVIEYFNKNNAAQSEIDAYLNNSATSLKEYMKFYKNNENNNQIFNVFSKSNERSDGNGQPHGLKWNELSDVENLLIFVCVNFGIEDISPSEEDYKKKLNKRILENKKISPRLKNILENVFNDLNEAEELLLGA
jgi:hypothetical protein